MRKWCSLAFVAGFVCVFSSGCMSMSKVAPTSGVPLEALKTTATYDVLQDTEGTSTGAVLFGFIPIGVENKNGVIATGVPTVMDPVSRAAVYNAIEAVPTADAMLAPRWNKIVKNYFIYKELTVTVKGKAIRYNPSAK